MKVGSHLDIKQQYIDGEWSFSQSGATREIINPFNQTIIAKVTESNEEDAHLAISAARKAFDTTTWPTISTEERAQIVHEIANLIERDKEELAMLETLDT